MSVYDHLEYKHLKAIVAIADARTFTGAAEKLHLAQSALSRQIGELEDALKIQIFERDRFGSTPTPAGESLVQFARNSLKARIDIINAVQAIQQAALMPFRLGFTPFIEDHVIEAVIESYKSLFPRSDIQVDNGDTDPLVERLQGHDLDAILVTLPLVPDGYAIQQILHRPLVVCIRKDDPLAVHNSIDPQLLNGRLAVFSDPRHHQTAYARLMEMLNEQGIKPQESNPTFNLQQIQWMVRSGRCVALIRDGETLRDDLTTRPITGLNWTVDSAIVYRRDHDHLALPLLLRELEKRFSAAEPSEQKKPPVREVDRARQQELAFGENDQQLKRQTKTGYR